MKQLMIFTVATMLALTLSTPALSEKTGILENSMNDVSFMTGGISKGERAEMESMSANYNLKVVLAEKKGTYLARLPVSISDAQGETLLEVETNGPWLYARLPDGRYTVRCGYNGVEKQRTIQVDTGLEVVMFHWGDR